MFLAFCILFTALNRIFGFQNSVLGVSRNTVHQPWKTQIYSYFLVFLGFFCLPIVIHCLLNVFIFLFWVSCSWLLSYLLHKALTRFWTQLWLLSSYVLFLSSCLTQSLLLGSFLESWWCSWASWVWSCDLFWIFFEFLCSGSLLAVAHHLFDGLLVWTGCSYSKCVLPVAILLFVEGLGRPLLPPFSPGDGSAQPPC